MIDLYTANTSNGQRAAIMLAECELPYRVRRIDLAGGEQRQPWFLRINPAGTVPAIVDHDAPGGAPLALAQSGAILLYLAMKTGRFFPLDPARRAEAFQWLMHATTDTACASMTIFLLQNYVPEKSDANVGHFEERVVRFLRVADGRLADRDFLAGEVSIADFALYPIVVTRRPLIDRAGNLRHLTRWAAALAQRPGVRQGMAAAA